MRPSRHETMLMICEVIGQRSTCPRRNCGCVLTDHLGRVLSMGHNGVAVGEPHCKDTGGEFDRRCPGADLPSGTGLDKCQAIHAEQNALMFCADVDRIDVAYVSASPCFLCLHMLKNTGCRLIVFRNVYPGWDDGLSFDWMNSADGRGWLQVPRGM